MIAALLSELGICSENNPVIRPLLFTAGAAALGYGFYCHLQQTQQKKEDARSTAVIGKWYDLVKIYYTKSHIELIKIYEALGLIPLIIKMIDTAPYNETLGRVNKLVQEILVDEQAHDGQYDNDSYIASIKSRLEDSYRTAGITKKPILNLRQLIQYLPLLNLKNPMPDVTLDTQDVANIRLRLETSLNTEASTPSNFFLHNALTLLAEDLNAIHNHFGKRIFMNLKEVGITEVRQDPTDEAYLRRCRAGGSFMITT